MSRDTIIRETAFAMWQAEGRPEGRDAEHWRRAEDQISRSAGRSVTEVKTSIGGRPKRIAAPRKPGG